MKSGSAGMWAVFFAASAAMGGCRAWDGSQVAVRQDPIAPKLPALERKLEDAGNRCVMADPDRVNLFADEVEENLTDPYGAKSGSITMAQNIIRVRPGIFIPSMVLLGVPTLFGVPFAIPKITVEVELRVMDARNRMIGKYSAVGNGRSICALYYGYPLVAVYRKTYVDAVNDAFDRIRPQIRADAARLDQLLRDAKQ